MLVLMMMMMMKLFLNAGADVNDVSDASTDDYDEDVSECWH